MQNKYYYVGDLANHFGVTRDTIRWYDKVGLLSPEKEENGYRAYSREDIIAMDYIMRLRWLNIPLKQIKEIINESKMEDVVSVMQAQEVKIDQQIDRLISLKRMIEDYHETCSAILKYENKIVTRVSPRFLLKPIDHFIIDVMKSFDDFPRRNIPKYTFSLNKEDFLDKTESSKTEGASWRDEVVYKSLTMVDDEDSLDSEELEKRGIQVVQPQKCIYSIVKTITGKDYSKILQFRDEIIKRDVTINGKIIQRLILINNINSGGTAYYECWVPIE